MASHDGVTFAGPYVLSKVLGHGSYGQVKLGKHGKLGRQVAVKILKKSDITKSKKTLVRVEREVTIMRLIDHPAVTQMIDVIQSDAHLFIILELLEGGDLFHYLRSHGVGGLPPDTAFKFFYQIISGLEYCHSCCICHRDIKPENILLDANNNAKLADFGMANLMNDDKLLETSCGSPHYAAPEVIKGGKYDGMKADIWSMGVLLYGLYAGRLPFDDPSIPRLLEKVCKGKYRMPSQFDEPIKDLITAMVCLDVDERISIQGIKSHPFWISSCQRLGLSQRGMHCTEQHSQPQPQPSAAALRSGGERPGSAPLPPQHEKPQPSSPPASQTKEDKELRRMINDTQDSVPIALTPGMDSICIEHMNTEELMLSIQELQRYGRYLTIENASMINSLNAAEQETRDHPHATGTLSLTGPIQPEDMQKPVEEPYDHEILTYITDTHNWSDTDTLVNVLRSDKSAIEKAFYNLLLRYKAQKGSLQNLEVRKVRARGEGEDAPQEKLRGMLHRCRALSEQELVSGGNRPTIMDSVGRGGYQVNADHGQDGDKKKKGLFNRIFKKDKKEVAQDGTRLRSDTHVKHILKSQRQRSAPDLLH